MQKVKTSFLAAGEEPGQFTKKKEGNSYYKKYLYKIAGQRFIPKIVYYGEKKEQKKT